MRTRPCAFVKRNCAPQANDTEDRNSMTIAAAPTVPHLSVVPTHTRPDNDRPAAGARTRLDIVMPAHNEEARIGLTLAAYRAACPPDVRILVALDNCTDATEDVVAEHAAADTRIRSFRYPKLGKGGVVMETLRRTDADLVAIVDADCATPPMELLRLAAAARNADGVIAVRWHPTSVLPGYRKRPWLRRVSSVGFAIAVRRIFDLPFSDTQCGAKVLRRDAAHRIVPLLSSRDFLFDVDLLLTARALGLRIIQVPTVWIDREGSRLKAAAAIGRMAASLLRLWLHHRVIPVGPAAADPPKRIEVARDTGGGLAA
jgi:glycosyltransferase involved in cell wall biosynthesis